ncbi:MAG: hypothetical protein IPO27_00870 [Bacteroidetes bacterium]|nr:hypothetical protein [Bacteroidota bacterium]
MGLIILHKDYNNLHLIIITGVLASLCGFLYFNWNPSKMYMGDTGSQFLGVFLSAFGIIYFWNDYYVDLSADFSIMKRVLTVAVAFVLPIVDTTVVVVNRLRQGKSPFVGGRDHTTHSLAYMGLTDKQVAIVFAIIAANSTIMLLFIKYFINAWNKNYEVIFAIYFIALLLFFFYAANRKMIMEKRDTDKSKGATKIKVA